MDIHILPALKDNFIYLLHDGTHAAVVDPGEAEPVQRALQQLGLRLTHVLCTHHHHDHVGGIPALFNEWNCEVFASRYDEKRIPHVTRGLDDNEEFTLFNETFRVLAVPGHTLGQIAYFVPSVPALFPGDTLFSAGCGRLFEGTHEQMFQSLGRLKRLPLETKIYFGHEYTERNLSFVLSHSPPHPERIQAALEECQKRLQAGEPTTPTTLRQELEINPFLFSQTVEEFRHWREARNRY